jgi:hypothetical protein
MSKRTLLGFLLIMVVGTRVHAAGVYVKGEKIGQGVTRSRGPECFIITAAHVTGSRPTVDIIAPPGVRSTANIEMNLAGDVSILRVSGPSTSFCSIDREWSAGLSSDVAVNSVRSWRVQTVNEAGTVLDMNLEEVAFDPLYIFVRGAAGAVLQEGMSGSPVLADGRLAGIMLNVKRVGNEWQGTIFRLHYIDSIIQRIFSPKSDQPAELTVAELQRIDQNIATAKVALERKDCRIASQALSEVPANARAAIWTLFMARATECAEDPQFADPEQAFKYYTAYDQLVPGQTAILEKLATLGYAVRVAAQNNKERAAAAAARGTRVANLTGTWEYLGNRLDVVQSGSQVRAMFSVVSDSFSDSGYRVGDLFMTGTYDGKTFDGVGRQRDVPSDDTFLCNPKERVSSSEIPFNVGLRLTINESGDTLLGRRETKVLEKEEDRFPDGRIGFRCVIRPGQSRSVQLVRVR